MRTSLSRSLWAVASLAMLVARVAGQGSPTDETDGQPTHSPGADLQLRAYKSLGCYSDPGDMIDMGPYTFQALGWCQALCVRLAKPYLGLVNGTTCFCGDNPPSSNDQVDPSNCQVSCAGIDTDKCGGTNNWAIYNDGYQNGDTTGTYKITIPTQPPAIAQSGAAGTSSQVVTSTALVTQSGGNTVQTVITVTQVASASPDSSSGPNKVAIAVGVVVAVIVVAALVGALFFWMRYRKNKAIQDERMRHQMMTNMVTGEKPGSSYSLGDSRLDQGVMFQRRQSDGSIADNEDYSRRILKVTNPDGR